MPGLTHVILGVIGIGGAALGLMAVATSASQGKVGIIGSLILVAMAAMYVFSGYCGVRSLQRRYGWVRLNQVLWAMQVPVIFSPLISYSFSSGAFLIAWIQFNPTFYLGFQGMFGSYFTFNFFKPDTLKLGFNILALGITYYLARVQRNAVSPQE